MRSLDETREFAEALQAFYESPEGLQRKPNEYSMGELANWLWHFFNGATIDQVRRWIMDDVQGEWRSKHPGASGNAAPPPPPPPHPAEPPPGPGALPTSLRVIRVTDAQDGEIAPRPYSYWSNAWVAPSGLIYAFCGKTDGTPLLFRVNPLARSVERLQWPFPYRSDTEGWSWTLQGTIILIDGTRLREVNPLTGTDRVIFDVSGSHPGCDLWQPHSSDDGQTHSATLRQVRSDGAYPHAGTVVWYRGREVYFPAEQPLDESLLTKDGTLCIMLEGVDNRIANLETGEQWWIRDSDGAVGHSDTGPDFLVGEYSSGERGECVLWNLKTRSMRTLFGTWNMGHLSVRGGRCLLSNDTHLEWVDLQTGTRLPILAHGMQGQGYDYQVKGNLDPSGRVIAYVTNATGRMDLHLVVGL